MTVTESFLKYGRDQMYPKAYKFINNIPEFHKVRTCNMVLIKHETVKADEPVGGAINMFKYV